MTKATIQLNSRSLLIFLPWDPNSGAIFATKSRYHTVEIEPFLQGLELSKRNLLAEIKGHK